LRRSGVETGTGEFLLRLTGDPSDLKALTTDMANVTVVAI
jgi:hypothetical protein